MSSVHDYHQDIIDELIGWIAQQQGRPITTVIVAEHAGFSLWHMQRIFKKQTGITLGRYIKNLRLDQAALELIKGNEPVLSIALEHGYESQQTFTRAIKNYTGLNPGEIKRLPDDEKMSLLKWVMNQHWK
ncbi:helix-turn-helix transcriptional regulator [Pectobacterium parmentieri]|uniref:helix-turn-helix transcriptional regulator n=1 Tax=Pectobacterium parmentieri TaxID=1905730 RepID=UPI000EB18260|nr:helix-turn-helix transcriptional regulator [Pectobacterium parmentieri]MEA4110568.1 helix-turn-helix transcriptional regulator [Enterobacter hormaechei]HBC8832992.1 helix-turn-helix transcriptional regulator [Citrobacter freundii]HBH9296974.1 helix-turn-helix transcriptional regulator [Escherichia coli]HBZ2647899.1 helix-turn-helix transcriptional regulator [Klebsiella pneumoniae]RKO81158.1 AraC family transcriptional regulator [Pectobacterium parmentieri]